MRASIQVEPPRGLLLIADPSLAPTVLEQVAPTLARGGVSLQSGLDGAEAARKARRLVLFDGLLGPSHGDLLSREPPALLLATRGPEGGLTEWEAVLLGAALRGGSLVPAEGTVVRQRLTRLRDVQHAAEAASMVVVEAGGSRTAASLAADVLHELAVNAMLDAPVDAQGQPKYAHRRTEVKEIDPEDACELALAVEGGRIYLEAVDRFGRLTPRPFVQALASYGKRVQVNASGGGAGLGLRRMIEHSDAIAVHVSQGRESRVLCAVDLGEARRRAALPKSLLFCME
ncbi:hypothetical protein POL68_07020 [Stigmatella sp. ncwal1]|uniref:Uncharacterized protein n=1 Tax=Stigmatella ashevillensis TaxID=2995309 RepID=A0ABT5D3I7_9BACT|nr:hypothetical protein [Stigmatella ashevillena]MDC0708217.1 hypothetical protein [Stigmatella ashevillena]